MLMIFIVAVFVFSIILAGLNIHRRVKFIAHLQEQIRDSARYIKLLERKIERYHREVESLMDEQGKE